VQAEIQRRMNATPPAAGGRHARRDGDDRFLPDRPGDDDDTSERTGMPPGARRSRPTGAGELGGRGWIPDPYNAKGLRPPPAPMPGTTDWQAAGAPARHADPGAAPRGDIADITDTAGTADVTGHAAAAEATEAAAVADATTEHPRGRPAPDGDEPAHATDGSTVVWSATRSPAELSEPAPGPIGADQGTGPPPRPADATPQQRLPEAPSDVEQTVPRPATGQVDTASGRVRVVLSERRNPHRSVRTVVDVQDLTSVGDLLRSNLIGTQLGVALRVAAVAVLVLGTLPAVFALFPEIGGIEVLGLRLPWLLLGVLVYPFLLLLGWWHTRSAEKVEQEFADHVQD
jgi:hypothetical protein